MKGLSININCDLGEGMPAQPKLFPYIYSCSIACGGHYGDRSTIEATLRDSIQYQVRVGAHPSYPDKENFGRRTMLLSKGEFQESLLKQLQLYFECVKAQNLKNHHIKAHGALYNDLATNPELCDWYLEVLNHYPVGYLYVLPNSVLEKKAQAAGFTVMREAFLDRAYNENGRLVARTIPGAVYELKETVWDQLNSLLTQGKLKTLEGNIISVEAETFCVHGDHPRVLEFLTFISQQLNSIG